MRGGCVVALFVAGCGRLAFDPVVASGDAGGADTTDGDIALKCTTQTFDATPPGWTLWNDTAGFDALVTGGQFRVQIPASANGYAGANTQLVDMTGSSIAIEAVQVPASTHVESYIELGPDNNNLYTLNYSEGSLGFFRLVNGTRDVMNTQPYVAAADRWWRLRHRSTDNVILYETSGDGVTWQTVITAGVAFPINAVLIEVAAGSYAGGNAAPGSPVFDNFTYCTR